MIASRSRLNRARVVTAAALAAAVLIGAADEPAQSSIRFNQVGFEPRGPKRFVVASSSAVTWVLRDDDGRTIDSGRALPRADSGSGESVALVTIARPLPAGRYTLVADGVASRAITVTPRPFARLFRDAMSFFYQQRAGTPILARYVQRGDLARPAGHSPEIVSCFAGTDTLGVRWPGCAGKTDVTGGWYDAGDRGKYVVNAGISVWTLLNAYERAQGNRRQGGGDLMRDGALALPEAGNGVADLLDEVRYEVEWMLRMQLPAGTRAAVATEDGKGTRWIDGSGLAYHKVADIAWAPVPIRIEDDRGPRALYPPSTAATLDLAAVAAQAARIWRTIDPAFAKTCLTAATRAYAAATREPALFADTRFTGSGGYEDRDISDEAFWAKTELAVTTGEPRTIAALSQSRFARRRVLTDIGWRSVATAGTISMLTVRNSIPAPVLAAQRRALLASADRLLVDAARQGFRMPMDAGAMQWGSNGALLSRAIVLGVAYDVSGQRAYRGGVADALDYVLGRNPLDRSYVSGYGARPMAHPHHRFWAHQIDPSLPLPPPGVLSGGPNSTAMTDPVAAKMKGKCRPLTCWSDDAHAFTQNEVAINWNAPLVWVTAFLDGTGEKNRAHISPGRTF
jgi:endoglucanase